MNVVLAVITNILFGLLTSHLAQKRGRDGATWFVIGALLGLLGVLLLFLLPPPSKQEPIGSTKGGLAAPGSSAGSTSYTGSNKKDKDLPKEEEGPLQGSMDPDASHAAKLLYYREHDWYYLDAERGQQGPILFEDLRLAAQNNRINATSYVWCDGMPEWKYLQDLPEVFDEFSRSRELIEDRA